MVKHGVQKNFFNNPSVMCEGLKIFYGHVVKRMIESGIDQKNIESQLF